MVESVLILLIKLVASYHSTIVSAEHQTMERQITKGHMDDSGLYALITCPLKSRVRSQKPPFTRPCGEA